MELASYEGSDGVRDDECVVVVGDVRERRHVRLADAGGGLAVDEPEHVGVVALEGALDVGGVQRPAPGGVDSHDLGAGPLGDRAHPLAEVAVRRDQRRLTGFQQVREGRLHPRRSGAADREGVLVVGPEDVPQEVLQVVHHLDVVVVEVADDRGRHRPEHARVDVARTGAHQRPVRGSEFVGFWAFHTRTFGTCG